jgi:acetate kinase
VAGLPHNNRVGDIDAFAVLYLMKRHGLGVDEMARVLANEAGLAGISGGSGDVRDLEAAAASGDARARLALDVLVKAVRHYLGAFLVALGGLDVLSFSGGIGENCPTVRAAVCAGLSELGIELDARRNALAKELAVLSRDDAPVQVLLIPADEERIVAQAVAEMVADR